LIPPSFSRWFYSFLDEATSALDSTSEKEIQKAFDEIFSSENRTTIVIAHRLSTLRKMDRIIVLEDGKIIESGPHEKLLKNQGKYAELWAHQPGGFIQ
jgi:ABC-type multidrug transport system fused ATPase/permease subunit